MWLIERQQYNNIIYQLLFIVYSKIEITVFKTHERETKDLLCLQNGRRKQRAQQKEFPQDSKHQDL